MPNAPSSCAVKALVCCACRSKIKTRLETAYGEWVERIPAWIKWATQDPNEVLKTFVDVRISIQAACKPDSMGLA
jgi:hypothetical protein